MWDPPVNKRWNSPAIHFVNKTPQRIRARFANCISSIYPTASLRLSQAGSIRGRLIVRRETGCNPNENVIISPSDARRKLVGRSLPALNAPEQRLSEVPLAQIHTLASKCARKHESRKNLPTSGIYHQKERCVEIQPGQDNEVSTTRLPLLQRPAALAKISLQIRENETDIAQWQ